MPNVKGFPTSEILSFWRGFKDRLQSGMVYYSSTDYNQYKIILNLLYIFLNKL